MTDVVITQQVIEVVITPEDGPDILLTTTAPAEVVIFPVGMQGPPGGIAARFVQVSPDALWTVNHNLGFRPQVTVLSPGGLEIEAAIQHISVNQFTVSFNIPQAGSAEYQ